VTTNNEDTLKSLIPYEWFEADQEIIVAMESINAMLIEKRAYFGDLKSRTGAKSALMRGDRIAGFTFDGAAPLGWIKKGNVSEGHYFMPAKTSKDRKELRAEIDKFRDVTMGDFSKMFGGVRIIGGDGAFLSGSFYQRGPIFHKIGDVSLFGVPKGYPKNTCTKDVSGLVPVAFSKIAALYEAKSGLAAREVQP
jgi:hypothetical protein